MRICACGGVSPVSTSAAGKAVARGKGLGRRLRGRSCRRASRTDRRCTARRRSAATRWEGIARPGSARRPRSAITTQPAARGHSNHPPGEVGDRRGRPPARGRHGSRCEGRRGAGRPRGRGAATPMPYSGTWISAKTSVVAISAAPSPRQERDGVEERPPQARPPRPRRPVRPRGVQSARPAIERSDVEAGRPMGEQPGADQRAAARRARARAAATPGPGGTPSSRRWPPRAAPPRRRRRPASTRLCRVRPLRLGARPRPRSRRDRPRSASPLARGPRIRSRPDNAPAAVGTTSPVRARLAPARPPGRSGWSLDAAVSSGSIAATARVAVSSAAASKPPGANRSQTTTAATRSSRTTGSSIRDAVSMFDRRWARYDAASVISTGRRWAITWASRPSGSPEDASPRAGSRYARSAPTSSARRARPPCTPWSIATDAHIDGLWWRCARLTRPLRSIATRAAASPAMTLGTADVDEHGEDAEHDAATEQRELQVVARPTAATTLIAEGQAPVHGGVPCGAEPERRDEREQRVETDDAREDREHGQEHAQPAEPDQPELPHPRRPGHVEEERPEVAQVEQALASGGLADALGPRSLGHRHVDHAQVGHADEQLEQDLEAHRPEFDAVDQRAAAEEVAGERVGALARLLEKQSRQHRRLAAHQPADRGAEALVAPAGRVAARDHEVRTAFGLGEQHRDQLGGCCRSASMTHTYWPRARCSPATTAVLSPPLRSAPWRSRQRIDGLDCARSRRRSPVPSSLSSTKQISNGVAASAAVTLSTRGGRCRLVARGNDQADDWRAAARPFGSHGQRIGANPRTGHRL